MSLSDDDIVLIQDFLSGKLSKVESEKVQQRLSDPDFQEEMDLQKQMHDAIRLGGRDQVSQIIKGFEARHLKDEKAPRSGWHKWLILAILFILLSVSIFYLIKPAPSERIFAANYELMANVVDPIARGEADNLSAYQLYETRRYSEALDEFDKINPSQNKFLYEGLSYLQIGSVELAINALEQGLEFPPEGLKENLEWYLLLAYIRDEKFQKAIDYVQKLKQNSTHQYLNKIAAIEKKLQDI